MPDNPDLPEILSLGYNIADSAAIVCTHVARDGLPIRLARRDEPVHDVDTGWQFHCDVHDHAGDDDAVVWAVRDRPAQGRRGAYRVTMRHGVSRVRSGHRHTAGVIFHDAK